MFLIFSFFLQIVNTLFEIQWNILSIANVIRSYDGHFFKSFDLMSLKWSFLFSVPFLFIFIIRNELCFSPMNFDIIIHIFSCYRNHSTKFSSHRSAHNTIKYFTFSSFMHFYRVPFNAFSLVGFSSSCFVFMLRSLFEVTSSFHWGLLRFWPTFRGLVYGMHKNTK